MKNKLICLILALVIALNLPVTCAAVDMDKVICLPIIMYHAVKPGNADKNSITPSELEADLKYFKENGYSAITMSELIDYVDGVGTLPEKPVLLSFDDGYYNNYKYVLPLLLKYDTRIVLSIIVNAIDLFSEKPSEDDGYSHITWGQINEMKESGYVEIQNHSYNLHKIGKGRTGCGQNKSEPLPEYNKMLKEDIEKAQDRIYEMTGAVPNTFTYPYGKYNDNTVEIIKNLGFRATFSCEYGVNLIYKDGETDLFNMKRICRAHTDSIETLLNEAMKTLKYR